jgi:hypothetical protein
LLAGCATEEPRCSEAAEQLASCHGIDATTFVEACNQASADEASALADEVLAQSCPAAAGKADALDEWAFTEMCPAVMMSAYLVNAYRNPARVPLSADLKAQLRPQFGALVDRVQIHWGATLPDDWPMLHVRDAFMDVGAQTFGNQIFIAATTPSLETLTHELTHAAQVERYGGAYAFYRAYCRAFYRADFNYYGNALEVEAYANEHH